MSEATSHPAGIPCWADISTPDIDASIAFYTGLFGWTAERGPEESGGYTMLASGGRWVAGMGPIQHHGQPPAWMTYVTVADAGATAERVRDAGGTVMVEPLEVMTAGRMAVCRDSTGAVFSLWQPGDHIGAQLVDEPGALCWTELETRDIEGARAFYAAVFGWGAETRQGPVAYTEWQQDGRTIGGMMRMDERFPPQVPAHWLVYFGTADCDASTARAVELGGRVLVPPMDIQDGLRFSWVADAHGAAFGLVQMAGMTG